MDDVFPTNDRMEQLRNDKRRNGREQENDVVLCGYTDSSSRFVVVEVHKFSGLFFGCFTEVLFLLSNVNE